MSTPVILVIMHDKRRGSVSQQIGQLVMVAVWRERELNPFWHRKKLIGGSFTSWEML